jgi:lipopolysaccharide export system permease protein
MEARKQFNAHLASAFSIFSLSLLAIPLAMRVGRAETFVNATLALVISLLYYVLTSVAAWVKEPSLRPDILVWIPNLIVVALALHFLRKVERR